MEAQHFTTTLQADDGSPGFVELPDEVVAALGQGKRPPVVATLNGVAYRTTVAVYGGKHYLPVRKEIRRASGLSAGDTVDVTIALDGEPRVAAAPEDLARALAANPEAQFVYERLSYTHRKEYVDWLDSAKGEDTRRRRVERALVMLAEGRKEP